MSAGTAILTYAAGRAVATFAANSTSSTLDPVGVQGVGRQNNRSSADVEPAALTGPASTTHTTFRSIAAASAISAVTAVSARNAGTSRGRTDFKDMPRNLPPLHR